MDKTHVILISSVRPEPTSAGQIILYRHLVDQPEIELEIYGEEPKRLSTSMVLRRVLGRVAKWGGVFHIAVNCLWELWGGRWIDGDLPQYVSQSGKTVVMTVAQGEGFHAAQRFAKRHNLPLVVFFHDWWPDMASVSAIFRTILEKSFLLLAKECSLGLCVSEGMKVALGDGVNLKVLPPLSAKHNAEEIVLRNDRIQRSPFRILYCGNLGDYGAMLGAALEESMKYPEILLQVRGENPKWTNDIKLKMRSNGRWLEFAPRTELEEWLKSADAFLIPMVFDPEIRRRMETSFPSKLIEFAQFGKPLIVWGPEYCSAIRWGRIENKALCVTDPNPRLLMKSIMTLKKCHADQIRLANASLVAAKGELHPEIIQNDFLKYMGTL